MAAENNKWPLGLGDGGEDRESQQDSEGSDVFEEAIGGDDHRLGRSQEVEGNGSINEGHDVEIFEEAVDGTVEVGDAAGSGPNESNGVATCSVVMPGEGLCGACGVGENGEKENSDQLEVKSSSSIVENHELWTNVKHDRQKELDNVEVNIGTSSGDDGEMTRNIGRIASNGEPNENYMPGESEIIDGCGTCHSHEDGLTEWKIVHDKNNGVYTEGDGDNHVMEVAPIEKSLNGVTDKANVHVMKVLGDFGNGEEAPVEKIDDAVHTCSLKMNSVLDEACGIQQSNEVSSGEIGAGVNPEIENGDSDNVNLGEAYSVHTEPENAAGNVASAVEPRYQIQNADENEKLEPEGHSGILDASVVKKVDACQGENQTPSVPSQISDKYETDEPEVKECLDSEFCPSSDAPCGRFADNSEAQDRAKENVVTEVLQTLDDGKKMSSVVNSADSKFQGRDFISMEEYDESSSSDEGGSMETVQQASVEHSSSKPLDPPRRPAGLGSSAPLLGPVPRVQQNPRVNGALPQQQSQLVGDLSSNETEEYDETREKLQMIRVKFLRLAHRLGQTPHNVVVAQVLYRLGLAEQLRGSRNMGRSGAFSFDRASAMAVQLETAGQEPLDFSCTIMVIGKTGVGKSATINSIFDDVKFGTNAFQSCTKKVQDIVGMVQGIKVRVIDTPGLFSSCLDQRRNKRILQSVKNFIKKTPPDIVLYLDRLDMQSRDYGDLPLLRTITDTFGPSIWFNAIVVLTHAASAPPDGPNGTALSYEMFVTQRSHVVQQAIRQAAGDMRLMNPVSLVENHSACRTNRAGQRVLPNGQVWKPHLLLLSFASKILAEANTLLKLQDTPPGKPFGTRSKVPPLPFLLSSLLQSRPQLKLPDEQFADEETMDDDIDETSDSDEDTEYDELPPFKRLTKAQLAKLSKEQRRDYFDELDYREKLFMKKQLKEEKKRRKLLKKMSKQANDSPNDSENVEEGSGGAASVPVPVPDMPLPSSFDSDNPTHRYRYLDNSSQWLVRPVLETNGWDHDVGYEGVNVERLFVVKEKIPLSFSGQVTKDKKESNLQMELASSLKHGVGKASSFGFDMQTVGKDIAYTLRSEFRFNNFKCNKTAAGLSVNILGDGVSAGLKLEDILFICKRLKLVMSGGAMASRGDVAYGGTLEATLRDKDYPLGRMLSTLGLSVMDWHGDLAIGCNLQSQIPVGRTTNMIFRANLNNKGAGQVSVRLNSSEQLQIALVALIPVLRNVLKNGLFGSQSMQ